MLARWTAAMLMLAIVGNNSAVRFAPRHFVWLGSSSNFANDAYVLMLRTDAPVKSIAQARDPGGPPLVLGSTAEGTTGSDVPMLLRDTLGLNINPSPAFPVKAGSSWRVAAARLTGARPDALPCGGAAPAGWRRIV